MFGPGSFSRGWVVRDPRSSRDPGPSFGLRSPFRCHLPVLRRHLSTTVKIVVVSPHRDDAAFSLGLSIDGWLGAGHQVTVLNCFTQSDYAPFSDVASVHANDRVSFVSAVRRREDAAWGKLVGPRLQFHDLDLLDAPLRLAIRVDEVQTASIRAGDRAVSRVAGALAKLARGVGAGGVGFALPLAVGSHIDHRVVRQAALETLAPMALPLAFYEDLPYAARAGAGETLPEDVRETGSDLQPCSSTAAPRDPDGAVRRKTAIAECYDSQIDSAEVRAIAEFSRGYGGRERLWANPAWRHTGLCNGQETQA